MSAPRAVVPPLSLRFFAVGVIALITCACAPQGNVRPQVAPPDPLTLANRQLSAGDYAGAAQAYSALAAEQEPREATRLRALAALAYQDAGDQASAEILLTALETGSVGADSLIATAKSCSLLANGMADQAYALATALDTAPLTPYQRGHHARCLGAAALQTAHYETAASAYTSAYRYPMPAGQAPAIAAATWQAVSRLSAAQAAAQAESGDATTAGWYALSVVAQRTLFDPPQLIEQTAAWQQHYPGHPATSVIETLIERAETIAVRPRKIALVLPFEDTLGPAARAIRDGFIAAWYMDPAPQSRAELRIYSSDENDISASVGAALADGAEFIVGPLRKTEVEQLRNQTELGANLLALNVSDQPQSGAPAGFYQFGLTPEDEAGQIAGRAFRSGPRALVMAPDTAWGKRLTTAYSGNWNALGGTVVSEVYYQQDAQAYATAVRRALNIHLSEARFAELRRTLNLPLHFEPRGRQDVDVILLAAFPDNARQIMPQLRYHGAADIPVFTTSHVYAGSPLPRRDSDFDGITFADMPWLFGAADRDLFDLVQRAWSDEARSFARLYGFGIDAYRVLPYLAKMRFQQGLRIPGVTGELWMDQFGVVHRNMVFVRFADGRPKLLDSGQEY